MIAECPSCNRQFRIHAWQLSAAKGLVQCGFCDEQFNALDHLHDHPTSTPAVPESGRAAKGERPEEPQFDIPGTVEMDEPDEGDVTEIDKLLEEGEHAYDELQAKTEDDLEIDSLSRIGDVSDEELETIDDGQDLHISELDNENMDFEAGLESRELDIDALSDDDIDEFGTIEEYGISEDEIPPELLDDEDQETPLKGRRVWITGIILLIILAVAQFIWFNRDQVMAKYPGLKPYFNSICGIFSCELIRARDISTISLLNRDVRDHPRFSDSLLVNATIENQAGRIQPYPQIRLTLFDTDGNITGYRTFKPEEYLDQGVNILAGMPDGIPVHIVLEVAGAREAAVSFEFDFL